MIARSRMKPHSSVFTFTSSESQDKKRCMLEARRYIRERPRDELHGPPALEQNSDVGGKADSNNREMNERRHEDGAAEIG